MSRQPGFHFPTLQPLAAALIALYGLAPQVALATKTVSNCNDSGGGSLRQAILDAAEGELVDASTLVCSTISLSSALLIVANNSLKIDGPGTDQLTIDGTGLGQSPVIFHNGNGTLEIDHLTIRNGNKYLNDDVRKVGGGCIGSVGSVKLVQTKVTNCAMTAGPKSKARGGAIYAAADLTLTDSIVSNSAVHGASPFGYEQNTFGGGLFAKGQITITTSTISGNHAIAGGGIYSSGNARIYYSTVSGNDASNNGGGIACFCGLEMKGSTISGNRADFSAGLRLFTPTVAQPHPSFIANSTFTGNQTLTTSGSAAIETAQSLTISNSTIAFNRGPDGANAGAVFSYVIDGTLDLESTIVAENYPGDVDAFSDVMILGAKNLSTNSLVTMPEGTLTDCPQLEPLANHGGPTSTLAIKHTSPAINVGNNLLGLATDQRGTGFPRVFEFVDIGAWEWQGGPDDNVFHDGFNPFPGACN